MSSLRTSIALLTFIMFSMGFLPFKPSLTAQQPQVPPAASGTRSFYWEQEPLQRIPTAPGPPPPSS